VGLKKCDYTILVIYCVFIPPCRLHLVMLSAAFGAKHLAFLGRRYECLGTEKTKASLEIKKPGPG